MPHADLTELIDSAGGQTPDLPSDRAASTAALVLAATRNGSSDPDAMVSLADRVGLDTLAALWRPAGPVSVAGALWALYLLRHWCQTDAATVVRLWRLGEPEAAADVVVAGVDARGDEAALRTAADAILTRAFVGDFGVALERGAALFRVLAAGRRELGRAGRRGVVGGQRERRSVAH